MQTGQPEIVPVSQHWPAWKYRVQFSSNTGSWLHHKITGLITLTFLS